MKSEEYSPVHKSVPVHWFGYFASNLLAYTHHRYEGKQGPRIFCFLEKNVFGPGGGGGGDGGFIYNFVERGWKETVM